MAGNKSGWWDGLFKKKSDRQTRIRNAKIRACDRLSAPRRALPMRLTPATPRFGRKARSYSVSMWWRASLARAAWGPCTSWCAVSPPGTASR